MTLNTWRQWYRTDDLDDAKDTAQVMQDTARLPPRTP